MELVRSEGQSSIFARLVAVTFTGCCLTYANLFQAVHNLCCMRSAATSSLGGNRVRSLLLFSWVVWFCHVIKLCPKPSGWPKKGVGGQRAKGEGTPSIFPVFVSFSVCKLCLSHVAPFRFLKFTAAVTFLVPNPILLPCSLPHPS